MRIEWNKVTWYSKLLALILFASLPFIGFYLGVHYQKLIEKSKPQIYPQSQTRVCRGSKCVTVEVAENVLEQAHGLMFREHMEEERGMLFIFKTENIYPFWMKNTLIPLDMIWMNDKKEIVYIHKGAEPCKTMICPSINPATPARYVLEVNAGVADIMGLKVGDTLTVENKR